MSSIDATHGEPLVLEQRAVLKSFVGLSIKNALLNIVTLTLYRFWARTAVRRRIWSSTYINGEALEYTGRGVELFIGFLIALGVIVLPLLVIVFGAQLMGPGVTILVVLPLYILVFWLFGVGMFTAFRYIASRTSWRGVRFHLAGSPFRYGLQYLGYGLLSAITLGWFWPAARRRLAAPLWDGLRFGDRRFQFDIDAARKVEVYGAYALGWVAALVAYIVFIASMTAMVMPMAKAAEQGQAPTAPHMAIFAGVYALAFILAVVVMLALSAYHAAALRSVAAGISFEGVRFRLKLKGAEMAWLTLSTLGLAFISLGFLLPMIEARAVRYIVNRIEPDGVVDLSAVRQTADTGPRTGEGIADAFGISPI